MIPREILRILQALYSVPMEQVLWFPWYEVEEYMHLDGAQLPGL